MTPVERLQAAIDKLEAMRSERGYVEFNGWLAEEVPGDVVRDTLHSPREDLSPITNDELIVVLHRTIDAQLALLREALDYATDWNRGRPSERGAKPETIYRKELALAAAILGGDS